MINVDLRTVEYPFLKLPSETAINRFRQQKKLTEKEISRVLRWVVDLRNDKNSYIKEDVEKQIEGLILSLKELKKRIASDYKDNDILYEQCLKRISHLKSVIPNNKPAQTAYHQMRAKRLIVEELARNGFNDNARNIADSLQIKDFSEPEIKVIEEQRRVIEDLKLKSISLAMEWCEEYQSKLDKIGTDFRFKLIAQQFMNYIKENCITEARQYIQKFSKQYGRIYINEIQKLSMCLVIHDRRDMHPNYKPYFEEERWNDLIEQFKNLSFSIYGLTARSQFATSLLAGIATLKTLNCMHEHHQSPQKCPVCAPTILPLSTHVPLTHRITSQFICRITGELMDEHNPPFIMKNNQVFSKNGVERMKAEKQSTCPITGEEINWDEARKIFLC